MSEDLFYVIMLAAAMAALALTVCAVSLLIWR